MYYLPDYCATSFRFYKVLEGTVLGGFCCTSSRDSALIPRFCCSIPSLADILALDLLGKTRSRNMIVYALL